MPASTPRVTGGAGGRATVVPTCAMVCPVIWEQRWIAAVWHIRPWQALLPSLVNALDQFDVAHAGFNRLRYIVTRNIHAETRNGIGGLRRRRRKIAVVGDALSGGGAHQAHRLRTGGCNKTYVRNEGAAHHHQVSFIGICFGYQSGDMIRARGADDGGDGQARHYFHSRRLKAGLQLAHTFPRLQSALPACRARSHGDG